MGLYGAMICHSNREGVIEPVKSSKESVLERWKALDIKNWHLLLEKEPLGVTIVLLDIELDVCIPADRWLSWLGLGGGVCKFSLLAVLPPSP